MRDGIPPESQSTKESDQPLSGRTETMLALAGAASLILGPFLPFIEVPLVGSINYFSPSRPDSLLVVLLGVGALVTTFLRVHRALWPLGVLAATILAVLLARLGYALQQLEELANSSGLALFGLVLKTGTSIGIGLGVMLLGSALLIASSLGQAWPSPKVRRAVLILSISVPLLAYLGTFAVLASAGAAAKRVQEEDARLARERALREEMTAARTRVAEARREALATAAKRAEEESQRQIEEERRQELEQANRELEAERALQAQAARERRIRALQEHRAVHESLATERERERRAREEARRLAAQEWVRDRLLTSANALDREMTAARTATGAGVGPACRNLALSVADLGVMPKGPDGTEMIRRRYLKVVAVAGDFAKACQAGRSSDMRRVALEFETNREELKTMISALGSQEPSGPQGR